MLPDFEHVPGLIPPEVGQFLYAEALRVPQGEIIVEIGSYKGKSTCYLAAGSRAGAGVPVHAIDLWDTPGNPSGRHGFASPGTYRAFVRNIEAESFKDLVNWHVCDAQRAAPNFDDRSVGLLYIDGDHSEAAVRSDFEAFERANKLSGDAVVIFDDLDTPKNPGVRAAIEALSLPFTVEAGRLAVCRA